MTRDIGLVSETFAGVGVRNVHFNNRSCNGFNSITYPDGGVCIRTGIENNAIVPKTKF
jgi:hypothetical protein